MDWTAEAQKLDDEIALMVRRDKQPERLIELFPTAAGLTKYSNAQFLYPHRRNSVLALAVQSGKAEVLQKILHMYFSQKDSYNEVLKLQFLAGTDSCGRYFNYHYFAEDFSPEQKARAKQFKSDDDEEFEMWDFKIRYNLLPRDERSPEQIERVQIYELIKREATQVFQNNDLVIERNHKVLARNAEGRVVEELMGEKQDFILLRECNLLSEIQLNDNRNNYKDNVLLLKMEDKRNFAQQAFEGLYFPELYYWARESLNKMQKMLQNKEICEKTKNLEDFFILSDGTFEISRENNLCPDKSVDKNNGFSGVCRYSPFYNKSTIVFPAEKIVSLDEKELKCLMAHEMTHNLDMIRVQPNDKKREQISDTDLVKFSLMALVMELDHYDDKVQQIPEVLQQYYKVGSFTKELIAIVMQTDEVSDCPLLRNLQNFIKRSNQAKLNKDNNFLPAMSAALKKNMPDYEQVRQTYTKFILWLRSYEQYHEMQSAGKTPEYLKVLAQKGRFREQDFARNYHKFLMRKGAPRFDIRMADLLEKIIGDVKQPVNQTVIYRAEVNNR